MRVLILLNTASDFLRLYFSGIIFDWMVGLNSGIVQKKQRNEQAQSGMITERLIFLTAFMAGAGALAFGAHTAVGVWTAPAAADLTIPALPPSEPPQQPTQPPGRTPLPDLAPLFGTTPEPEPQDAFLDDPPVDELFEGEPVLNDDLPYFDDYAFQLRGLLVDETGAMAILDTPEGTQIVREGSILESGEEVLAITEDGLELEFQGEVYLISFDDLDDPLGDDF